jgi:hypothetical protein
MRCGMGSAREWQKQFCSVATEARTFYPWLSVGRLGILEDIISVCRAGFEVLRGVCHCDSCARYRMQSEIAPYMISAMVRDGFWTGLVYPPCTSVWRLGRFWRLWRNVK